MASKKLRIFILLLIIGLISAYLYSISRYKSSIYVLSEAKQIDLEDGLSETTSETLLSQEKKFKYINTDHPNSHWLVNHNILQYSSYLIIKPDRVVRIESLMLTPYLNFIDSQTKLKCVLKYSNGTIAYYPVTEMQLHMNFVDKYPQNFGKLICQIELILTAKEMPVVPSVAIVDQELYTDDKSEIGSNNVNGVLSQAYINFQIPKVIDASGPKKKSIGHCVHMVHDLENHNRQEKVLNWLKIQKSIGIDTIRMYFYRYNNTVPKPIDKILLESTSVNFLDIVYHKVKYNEICGRQEDLYNKNSNSTVHKRLVDLCNSMFNKFFDLHNTPGAYSIQEEICINDCYMNFRHIYEIVTNYDFDELIFPVNVKSSRLNNKCDDSPCDFDLTKYNLYKYARHIIDKYENKTATVHLSHAIMVKFSPYVSDFMVSMKEALSKVIATNTKSNIILKQPDYYQIEFEIDISDVDYVKELYSKYELYKCLIETHSINGGSSFSIFDFTRLIAVSIPTRFGKSFHDTNFAEIINQHITDAAQGEKELYVNLPFEDGFVGHFRESYQDFFKYQIYSIKHVRVQTELIQYLMKLFNASNKCVMINNNNNDKNII